MRPFCQKKQAGRSNQPVPHTTQTKKPFIPAGRKGFPWYHPNSYLIACFQYPRSERKRMDTTLIGGPEGARTPDLIHAMDALFQLRYRPRCAEICTHFTRYRAYRQALETFFRFFRPAAHRRVRPGDVALQRPATLCVRVGLLLLLTAYCKDTIPQCFAICKALSSVVEMRGLEPLTSTVRLSRSSS
jgi:hypothetical protein